MEILGYIAAIFIGIALGLIGAGGSILAFPILVYLFKIDTDQATSYSLFIVGIAAFVGAIKQYRLENLKIKTGIIFAIPSVISLLVMRNYLLPRIPAQLFNVDGFILKKHALIMIVFALLMIAASYSMIRKVAFNNKKINYLRLSLIGLVVGLVVGLLGAGGGFLIIPALIFFAGLTFKEALGTSLLIIFINSIIGFSSDIYGGAILDIKFLLIITAIAVLGLFIGTALSKKISGEKLKPAFGWFIIILGIYIIINELFI